MLNNWLKFPPINKFVRQQILKRITLQLITTALADLHLPLSSAFTMHLARPGFITFPLNGEENPRQKNSIFHAIETHVTRKEIHLKVP